MISEKDYVIDTFRKNFSEFKNRRVVLYGLGFKTQIILEGCPDYNFVGLMDPNKGGETIFGKKVLTYDEVLESNVEAIIVVARPNIVRVITRRILTFCQKNKILLYDINKNDLSFGVEKLLVSDEPYLELNENDLKKKILGHDIISFDIFDTLIMRKVLYPQDVFDIVEHKAVKAKYSITNFRDKRAEAERLLLLETNPNIYEIYDLLQQETGLTDEEKECLLQLEIFVEKQVLIKRNKMVDMLKYAVDLQKKVYLISDMYLPKDILENILGELGISGYSDIFVSCEYRTPKYRGLFSIFKEKVAGESYLHIGDNKEADGVFAELQGMDSYIIKSAVDMLELSSYREIFHHLRSVNDRSLAGLFVSKVFNNPFSLYQTSGRPEIRSTYDVGYLFIAPLITNFIVWLLQAVKKQKSDYMLFAARDGYLIHKLYDAAINLLELEDMPKGIYFLTSRMVSAASTMVTDKDIAYVASLPFAYSQEKLLEIRFGLSPDEILPYDQQLFTDIESYALAHKQKIVVKSKELRSRYLEYVKSLGIQDGSKVGFFDFVSSGTCQMYLSDILPFDLVGLYFVHYLSDSSERKNKLPIHALFENGLSYQSQSYAFDNYYYLETVITSFAASLASFDENVQPVYSPDTRSLREMQKLKDMHEAITDYFNDYIEELYIKTEHINEKVSDTFFNGIDNKYTDIKDDTLEDVILVDDFGVGKIEVIC